MEMYKYIYKIIIPLQTFDVILLQLTLYLL